jgi:4-hydroxybutyryl-CoA dehydratase/vinylacetyl-CoA-Delta-isomerase
MMTARQYEQSLRELKLELTIFGRKIDKGVDDPIICPSINAVAAMYDFEQSVKKSFSGND